MFSIYKTLHPPTGIDNSVFCNFVSSKEQNLIVSSANKLQIFRLNPESSKNKKLNLECVDTFHLYGNISCMKSCRYGSMVKDALILAFEDAKLSIVQYDNFTGDLVTLSMHYFENENESEGTHYNIFQPVLKVDPNMRCAVMLVYGFKLVVIPFYEEHPTASQSQASALFQEAEAKLNTSDFPVKSEPEITLDTSVNSIKLEKTQQPPVTPTANSSSAPVSSLSSYTIDLRQLDSWLEMRIIDIEFLYGYYEPTLFILSESNMTWVGRYAVKKDTCNSVALSLNLNQKTHPIIWPVDKLPSDCIKCLAVPPPIGGILIFAVNSLIYINQSIPSYGISLNSIAKNISSYPFKNMEHVKITLDGSQAVFVAQDRLVISLRGGELYIVSMITDSESLRTVRSFNIEKGPGSVIANCLTKCSDNFLFIGSRLGNSVLLKYTAKINKSLLLPSQNKRERKQLLSTSSFNEQNNELDYDFLAGTTEGDTESGSNSKNDYENGNSKRKFSEMNDEFDELDEILETNEESTTTSVDIVSYSFEICDILLNVAPCGHSIIGESVGDYSEFNASNPTQYHIDLVTSSGHTKNGAISVLQRSLRPEVIATFRIPDIIDMWSVFNENETSPTFLFLSKSDSTMVLQLANEITELEKDNFAFCTKYATVYCSNMVDNKYILQVTTSYLYVYSDCSETGASLVTIYDLIPLLDSKIKHASSLDSYIVIQTEKGTCFVFLFNEIEKTIKLIENNTSRSENVINMYSLSCFTLFKDETNIFSSQLDTDTDIYKNKSDENGNSANGGDDSIKQPQLFDEMNVDDEDEMLYGTSSAVANINGPDSSYISKLLQDTPYFAPNSTNDTKPVSNTNETEQLVSHSKANTHWLVTVSVEGALSIIHLKDDEMELVFTASKFNTAPKTLILNNALNETSPPVVQQAPAPTPVRSSSLIENNQSYVYEILMTTVGSEKNRPMLIAKIDEDLIIYETFLTYNSELNPNQDGQNTQNILNQVNLKRLSHDMVIRDKRKRKTQIRKNNLDPNSASGIAGPSSNTQLDRDVLTQRTKNTPSLRQFNNNIAGFNGFFLMGSPHSYFVFFCPRSGLIGHPIWIDGPILSFTPLKNISITLTGFIFLNKNFDIRISTLPVEDCNGKLPVYYDSKWILRKIQLRQTVHFICYHEESKTYAVVTSISESTNKLMQLGGEDKELEEFEKDENFILPQKSQFFIQLYTPTVWEALPLGKYTLSEWEHVTSLKLVSLPYEGHSSGFRSYLAASTINCYNEDVNSRGRVIILDVIETVPEPDKPLTCIKMKIILEKEQKGPVTCLESVNGYLLGGVGQKVFIWEYKNNELIGKAFIDTHFYIHKMITLKNFVLIADLHRSISLIRFQKEYTKLCVVAKDKQVMDVYGCDYLVDNTNLGFIATDADKNLNVFMYQNESHDNQGGSWLVRKAEFNVGSHVNSMFRLKCKVNDPNQDKKSSLADKRQVTYCTNLDGGIGYIIPISEKTFRRLFMLQNAIFVMVPHYAGLNPKAFRAWRSARKELCNPQKNILDGDLLFEYFNLSYIDRNDIAKKIKTNPDQLLDDLTEIFQFTCHF